MFESKPTPYQSYGTDILEGQLTIFRLDMNMTGQVYYAKVKATATIAELRAFIAGQSGMPYNRTGLVHIGRTLKGHGTVGGQSCISNGDTIYFGSMMFGGVDIRLDY
jgi:hypothetical protein